MDANYFIWDPNPIFFTVPGLGWPVRWYGFSWALAFFFGSSVLGKIFKKENRPAGRIDAFTYYMLFSTLIGARIGHCLFYDPGKYLTHPLEILKINEGGLASHGAAIGILAGILLFCRRYKENPWWLMDRTLVVIPLSSFFIRMGNFFNSEIVGRPSSFPLAIIFPQVDQQPRHPTQLYEAFFYLLLFGVVYRLWSKKRENLGPGFIFGFVLVLQFVFRFFVEFLKENQSAFENNLVLNMGQLLSIPFVIMGIYMMRRAVKSLPPKA